MRTGARNERRATRVSGIFLILYFSSLVSRSSSLYAAFEDIGIGARASALGGGYVAIGDDTLSLFYNPAGLARLRQKEVASDYSRFFAGLTDGASLNQYTLRAGYPLRSAGTIALGWNQFNFSSLYTERTLSLGYGQWLTPRFAAGFALKQLYHSYATPSTMVDDNGNVQAGTPSLFNQDGSSKGNFSFDTGFLYHLTDRQWLGFSIQDMNEPNVSLDPNDPDPVPRLYRLGWAHQSAKHLSLTANFNTSQCPCDTRDYTFIGGAEKIWSIKGQGDFAARGALTLGSHELQEISTGFGVRFATLQLDYAFVFNLSGIGLGTTAGTHRFSLSYRFGSEPLPATTPRGTVVGDTPVNILRVPNGSMEGEAPYSLEQDNP